MRSRTLLIVTFCLLLVAISASFALESVPIEGEMLVSAVDDIGCGWSGDPLAYFIRGASPNISPAPVAFIGGDVSPHGDEVVYMVEVGEWPDYLVEIWVAGLDGSDPVNVSALAGLEGINCVPEWSPDGSKIAFQHCDPVEGILPCDAGFHAWVMDADGADAHRVLLGDGPPTTTFGTWSPNGYRVLLRRWETGDSITVDIDGDDPLVIPNIGGDPDWSRDGLRIASTKMPAGDGEAGVWRQLVMTNADGSDPQVLVEQFLSDADVQTHLANQGCDPESYDYVADVQWWAGPVYPQWSPRGNRIAFLAALPFNPAGVHYKLQGEVWVYDLTTEEVSRVTENAWHENSLSWDGHNTYPYDTQVTVENTTVTFEAVTEDGLTAILREEDPPDVPIGFFFDYAFYELNTTAEVTGPVTICMTYTDAEVPPAAEADLAILHWDGAEWTDITTSRDPVTNVICAETDSLSPIALHGIRTTKFPDVPAWGFGTDGLDPHWAYYQVMACVEARIVSGYEDGTYQPTGPVPRDQMAVFIARAMAAGDANVPDGPDTATFDDVPTDYWAYDYVEYCAAHDIVQGYSPVTYGPTNLVNRDAMAVFIARAHAGGDADVPAGPAEATFDDVPTDYWSYKYIEYCSANSIVQGYDPVTYGPTALVTRDQMAVYVARAFGLLE